MKRFDAFVIQEGKDKNFWHKCGVAFENRDGSLNVQLHSLPVDGKFQLREPKEKDE